MEFIKEWFFVACTFCGWFGFGAQFWFYDVDIR